MLVRTSQPLNHVIRRGPVDRSFDQIVNTFFDARRPASPMVDASWDGDEYVITADLPGVPASAVSVQVVGDQLVVSANNDGAEWSRTARLGSQLDSNKVHARHVDGRLTIRIGKVDTPEPRSIDIDVTPTVETASVESPVDAKAVETPAVESAVESEVDSNS